MQDLWRSASFGAVLPQMRSAPHLAIISTGATALVGTSANRGNRATRVNRAARVKRANRINSSTRVKRGTCANRANRAVCVWGLAHRLSLLI